MADSISNLKTRPSPKNSSDFVRHNTQLNLVHEDVIEVTRSLVAALGGAKVVGPKLFPQKAPDAAMRYLLDCLNPNRDQDIGVEGFFLLLRWGRQAGAHFALHWLCDELGYVRPQTVEPEDRAAEILTRVDGVREELRTLLQQLERLPRGPR